MYTRILRPKSGLELLVRPLRSGDTATVQTVFDRLSEASRRQRFHGPKPRLTDTELEQLARVDGTRHALVAYVAGDPRPAAIARLVRDGDAAEIAFAVVDEHQRKGIGPALTAELVADARAAGIRELRAHVSYDNPRALALLRRILDRVDVSFSGSEVDVRAALG
jgi:ribosomal protein S18 acetylase RimI-like enzyme